eukprot:TRINITY_DN88650_c0_g1_i1.p1 TRINITY_DN88650_c0_g1~~TRINITY_DN88650_c0_g1_i1.p1  ORF type:complete len:224 (+),score=35.39 TRINITY_DN88650_c0_g1_i1:86-673(+)
MAAAALHFTEPGQAMIFSTSLSTRTNRASKSFARHVASAPPGLEHIGFPPGLEPGLDEKHEAFDGGIWSRSTTCSATPHGSVDSADGDGAESDASKSDSELQSEPMFVQASTRPSTTQKMGDVCAYHEFSAPLGHVDADAARAMPAAFPSANLDQWYPSVGHANMNMPMKRFCHHCGGKRTPSYMFCPHCGTRFN